MVIKNAQQKKASQRDGKAATVTTSRSASFTVPTLSAKAGRQVVDLLQQRLLSLIDLSLTLRHIQWNVVGPNFIGIHEMLDPQHAGVQAMVNDLAQRISTLGGAPSGLSGLVVAARTWDDYSLDRADALAHLGALDLVYQGVIADHRYAIAASAEIDAVSQHILIDECGALERYHWFVRAHLEDRAGGMANAGATSEIEAAELVAFKSSRKANGARNS